MPGTALERSTTGEASTGGAQAIRRAMDVVRAVAQFQRTGATLSKIASVTGLSTSTAHRILRSLSEERMLRHDETLRRYFLGMLAFELGLATQTESQVQQHWRETIEQVARETRLTSYLMARSDCEAVCLICVQGSTTIRAMPLDVGQRLPLGIGAGSAAILATLEDAEIKEIMASNTARLKQFPGEGRQADAIRERIGATRAAGYAVSTGSVAGGLVGVGVPVLPRSGLLQLAVSVSAVADIMDPGEARRIAETIDRAIKARLAQG
ncbi:MAG: helix-turn-helix domain-containing protein [Novosphingobium sp.]|nr:helix-turn-helix domain-containing protein [Novosphingobium sp.]MCP5403158.1 helix-turn-helix domain-containing protein [Novosphingobium sp.]